ncbi:MAG: ABC transporter ATP-binding protein [Geminicoccaceae bacterium]
MSTAGAAGEHALLRMERVTAGYARDIDILQEVSLTLPEGQTVGVIGLNGAGKSTIMRTIYGFLHPKRGRIFLGRDDISDIPPHRMLFRRVWYIPQESSLFPYLTVEDNLALVQRKLMGARPVLPPRATDEVLERFPMLRERRRAQAGNLSGGQQKMLQFALALLVRPHLCLIDEPTVGLAPKVAEEVYDWIETFRDEEAMTILLVDHNVRKVIEMVDHVYVLSLGRIAAAGRPADFQSDLHQQVREWLGIRL